ncbi:MAG: hypothetical protein K2Y40_10825, partial [Reyranella sp.]|nr:hypothetical protein [Reyranella sp.]
MNPLKIAQVRADSRTMKPSILIILVAAALSSGCGWFDGGSLPPGQQGTRPGADRLAPVVNALPPPEGGRPHESGVTPADEKSGAAAGALVSGKGGQKVQREEAERQAFEQAKKAREARDRAQREADADKAVQP